jgi:hypothetical protein
MKISSVAAFLTTALVVAVQAANINVQSADVSPRIRSATRIGTNTFIDRPTALINKNSVSDNNNIFITRSNLLISQNDRVAMEDAIEEYVTSMPHEEEQDSMIAATMSKNILAAISKPDTDAALMTKVSAVVAAQRDDRSILRSKIADLLSAAMPEQAIQVEIPRGVVMLLGTKDILRQPSGIVNKNVALSDNQVSISNSRLAPNQDDQINMAGGAKVADVVATGSTLNVNKDNVRVGFLYRTKPSDEKEEQFGLYGFGWRYPLGYWNLYGRAFYPGSCGLGFAYGPYYYC